MFEQTESTTATRSTVMEVRNVNVTYDMGRGRARVLNDVDLDIYRGETLGIVGESGSGKSVFASALLDGVDDPGQLSGEITYYPEDGDPVNLLDLRENDLRRVRWEEIAMVYQGAMSSLNPTRSVETHFEETLAAHDADKQEGMERAREILSDLNLDPERILESHQHELSGGQQQRVLIALSLLLEPEVLVLDEPTAALDLIMQRTILRLLHRIKDEYDLTLVFISHDLPIVSGFADRLAVMYAFEFCELGPTEDVLLAPAHPYTRALLQSTPNLDTPIEDIRTVEGETPDPINVPSGCSYHTRCPIADERCTAEDPALLPLDEEGTDNQDHRAACFYIEQSRREIPTPFSRGDLE